jgi:hypothetical protein
MPAMKPLFPSQEIARALRNVVCVGPRAAAAGYHEPSLVFTTGTSTLLTDGSGAADFLGPGQLPLRAGRGALRAQLRAARRRHRAALRRRDAHRGLQFLAGAGDLGGDLSLRRHPADGQPLPRRAPAISAGWSASSVQSLAQLVAHAHAFAPRRSRTLTGRAGRSGSPSSRPQRSSTLMFVLDAYEIALMPPRGTQWLWPVRFDHQFRQVGIRAVDAVRGACACSRLVGAAAARHVAFAAGRLRHPHSVRLPVGAVCRAGRRGAEGRHRPRPAVRRRRGQCLQLPAVRLDRGLCQLPVGSCHHRFRAGLCRVSAVWPRLRTLRCSSMRSSSSAAGCCCWRIIRATSWPAR